MRRAAFHTLGCKVNSYETEAMQKALCDAGYEICSFEEKADVYIINTCTVTNMADRKSRQMIHRARSRSASAIVVAAGCYAEAAGARLKEDIAVDILIGNKEKRRIAEILEHYFEKTGAECKALNEENDLFGATKPFGGHTRAFLKIQDGCNQFCSYCIIPNVRGRIHSERLEDIQKEAERFALNGFRELVLTGIHLSSYGKDLGEGTDLGTVLETLDKIPGVERIRVGSLEPLIITEDFVERLKRLSHFCPHFHLSLQSGSDAVLKRMNRHYSADEYRKGVETIRRAFPEAAITTDVIVGFPGETEEEFLESRTFIREMRFYETHIFPYSRREGTRAADMPEQRTRAEKARRASELSLLNRQRIREFLTARIGTEQEILTEEFVEFSGESYLVGSAMEYVKIGIPMSFCERKNIQSNCLVRGRAGTFLGEDMLIMDDILEKR